MRYKRIKTRREDMIEKIAEKQLEKIRPILESLREYDEGKKDISTSKLEMELPHINLNP